MPVNLLAINVGNTRTQLGTFLEGKLTRQQRFAHPDSRELDEAIEGFYQPLREADLAAVYLASVNEQAEQRVLEIVEQRLGVAVLRMEKDLTIPIGRQLNPEAIVGEDRLLNAAAAYDRLKQACIIVDAGTAITVDFVDGTGTFHGGAILPGLSTQARALHDYTSLLPLVEVKKPRDPIGHSTIEAIQTGLYHGCRGAVRELIERYAEFYMGYPKVMATGGDAELLFEGYDLIETIVPDLTLQGMAVAHRYAIQEAE